MARLTSTNGDWLGLEPSGYQYPEAGRLTNDWDANWLMMQLDARFRGHNWTAASPCLTAGSLAHLAQWCEAVATGEAYPAWWVGPERADPSARL